MQNLKDVQKEYSPPSLGLKVKPDNSKQEVEEKIAQKRLEIWKPILEQMPEFQALSEKGKQNALNTLKYNPERFLEVIKKTPYYQKLSEKGKKNLENSLYMPFDFKNLNPEGKTTAEKHGLKYEGDSADSDVYMDPTGWLAGGAAMGLKAVPGIMAGDIVGETTKQALTKLTGHNIATDYILPLAADVISGHFGGKFYDKFIGKTSTKLPKTVEKAVSEEPPVKTPEEIVPPEKQPEPDELTQKMKQITEEVPKEKLPEEKAKEVAETAADIIDEVNDNIDLTPARLPKIDFKIKTPQEALDYFEKNLLGKKIKTPIGLDIKFTEKDFLNIIAGGNKKGFVKGAKSPEESYLLIKKGINPEYITGYQHQRARDLYLLPDILQDPHLITKDTKKDNYIFYKEYKVNGTKGYVSVLTDKNGNMKLISFHRKSLKTVLNKIKEGKEKIIFTRGLSRGSTTSAIGSDTPRELTNGISNNIGKNDEKGKKLYAGIPTKDLFKHISSLDNFVYKKFTSKIEDSKFDQFVRKYLLADKYGFGSLSRSKEDKIINDYLKLKAHLARGDLSAEKKEKILNKYLDRLDEGEKKIREKFMIQYLENPAVREKARQGLPEVAKELDQIRKEIDRLGKLKMERGLISPSQYEKWKDKYLTRLYLMEDEIEGLDITRGLKQYEEKKGRKIDSIVDFIDYLKKEDPIKAQEWEKKTILDPIKTVKATLAKSYANLAIDDFYRKMLDDPEIIPQKYLVELPVQINNLPRKMSPYYAENKVLPYLRDILRKDRNNKEVREAIKSLRKQIKEKKAIIEAEKQALEKAGYRVLGDRTKARYSVVSGLPVHKDVANMIEGMTRIIENPADTASKIDKAATTAIAYFKWAKVPANIFSYPRNMMSNWIQFAMSGADPVSFPEFYGKAVIDFVKKDKYYELAKKWGLFHSNLASEEISKIFREISQTITPETKPKKAFKIMLKFMDKTGEAYGLIDDLAKLARFRYALEVERKPVKEAIRIAQDTHFDYSLTYPVIRAMRDPNIERGIVLKAIGTLFPTYTQKSLSYLYDTILKRPATLTTLLAGFIALKHYIEQLNEKRVGKEKYEKLKKLMPEFLDNPFIIPIVDKDGKWITYIDPSYIVPFGNWVNFVQDLFTGHPVGAVRELGALSNPIYSLKGLIENKDPLTGRQIYYPHNKVMALKDIAKYGFNQFLAPGTIAKIDSLLKSKHPVIPRIATGMLWYEYPVDVLKSYKAGEIYKVKFDTNKWITKLKKELQYYTKMYNGGKMTKDEYMKKRKEIINKIKEYQQAGYKRMKEIIETIE